MVRQLDKLWDVSFLRFWPLSTSTYSGLSHDFLGAGFVAFSNSSLQSTSVGEKNLQPVTESAFLHKHIGCIRQVPRKTSYSFSGGNIGQVNHELHLWYCDCEWVLFLNSPTVQKVCSPFGNVAKQWQIASNQECTLLTQREGRLLLTIV
jgi:hypothetical protein